MVMDKNFSYASEYNFNQKQNPTEIKTKRKESVCQKEDIIIKNQSKQLLTLIEIIDSYRKDKLELRDINNLEKTVLRENLKKNKRYNTIQLLIFILILLFICIYICKPFIVEKK